MREKHFFVVNYWLKVFRKSLSFIVFSFVQTAHLKIV